MQSITNVFRSRGLINVLGLRYAAALQTEISARFFSAKEHIPGLEDALRAMVEASSPTSDAKAKRQNLIASIQNSILGLERTRSLRVMPFGSYASSFYDQWSDLDLVIYGVLQPFNPRKKVMSVHRLQRKDIAKMLERAAGFLVRDGIAPRGGVTLLTNARVPIIKFKDRRTGINVDISMGTPAAAFKAWSIEQIASLHPSFGDLLRMVKVWAKANDINDGAANMFNSWSITLLVLFYLQKHSQPKLLPPIRVLMGDPPPEAGGNKRLMQDGKEPSGAMVEEAMEAIRQGVAALKPACSSRKPKPLEELFGDFMEVNARMLRALLSCQAPFQTRGIGLSTYYGDYRRCRPFQVPYIIFIEDPYDSRDNTARSLRRPEVEYANPHQRKVWGGSIKKVCTLHHVVAVFERTARRLGRNIDEPSAAFDAAVANSAAAVSFALASEYAERTRRVTKAILYRKEAAARAKAAAGASPTAAAAADGGSGGGADSNDGTAVPSAATSSPSPSDPSTASTNLAVEDPSTASTNLAVEDPSTASPSAAAAAPAPASPACPSSLASTLVFLFGTELLTRLPDLSARLLGRELCGWARGALAAGRPEWEVHEGLLRRMGAAEDFETFHRFLRRHELRVFNETKYQTPEERLEAAERKAQQEAKRAARKEARRLKREADKAERQSQKAQAAEGDAPSSSGGGSDSNEMENDGTDGKHEGRHAPGGDTFGVPRASRPRAHEDLSPRQGRRRIPQPRPRPGAAGTSAAAGSSAAVQRSGEGPA